MGYTVIQLINDAYYASGIVSREFQTVSGSQINDGLGFLNDILADKTIERDMIPYYLEYNFYAIEGQERYFIPNLEELETLVFFINNVRYQMREVDRKVYFGSARANNITSLPFNWHVERCPGGANLYLYFLPNVNYPMQAWGQFRLAQVSINQDLMSNGTTANLGIPTSIGGGTLNEGELIVNGIDLTGAYASGADLVSYINGSGIVPNVTAAIVGTEFILTNNLNMIISVLTAGTQDPTNCLTFSNFSTTTGYDLQNFTPTMLDRFYINYLKFSLADRLCTEFNFIVPQGVAKQLAQYQKWISKRSAPLDLQQVKTSTLGDKSSLNYGQVNLGHGWTTS
jgi:hypothetical protein